MGEVERLRDALERIANPLKFIQESAERAGMSLDGRVAAQLASDAGWLKGIAKRALEVSNDGS